MFTIFLNYFSSEETYKPQTYLPNVKTTAKKRAELIELMINENRSNLIKSKDKLFFNQK